MNPVAQRKTTNSNDTTWPWPPANHVFLAVLPDSDGYVYAIGRTEAEARERCIARYERSYRRWVANGGAPRSGEHPSKAWEYCGGWTRMLDLDADNGFTDGEPRTT